MIEVIVRKGLHLFSQLFAGASEQKVLKVGRVAAEFGELYTMGEKKSNLVDCARFVGSQNGKVARVETSISR
nr:unnamed protein product [Haemonchus contortus]